MAIVWPWNPVLLWLHVMSDLLVTVACFSIPPTLVYFTRQRKDFPYPGCFPVCRMGLFISRSLIDAHEEALTFNSQPGKVTTFYLTLPMQKKAAEH
jgi:light-regulated signal transduction histidine kinase (bacteriophytochrome)